MKIDGQKFKKRRLQMGLSQKAIANGVCTQPTISLIEKRNHIPSFGVFRQLCRRLGSTPVDFLLDQTQHHLRFNRIVTLLSQGKLTQVQSMMDYFKDHHPKYNDLPHYFYFQGLINLEMMQLNEALLNFQQVLIHYDDIDNVWETLATLGIAITYYELNKHDWSVLFLERVLKKRVLIDSAVTMHQRLQILNQLAYLFLKLGRVDQCIQYAHQAIQECRSHESTFLLVKFFTMLGQAYAQKHEQAKSTTLLRIASNLQRAL